MAETDRPNLFENLPTDILLLVLDNIHLYSDLLALCLTSKACNSLATQRLYKNIVLDTCNWNDELPLICKCLDAGASKHLRYTQSLSLLDVPDFVMNMDLGWPRSRQVGRKDWITLRILRSFPQNQLATFRHISGLELGPSVMSLLESQQKSLVNVHVTRGDFQKLISPSSKRLTVGIFQHHQATDGLVELTQSLPELESLSLIFKTGVDRMASNWWGENGYEEHLPEKRIVTRELTLDGIIPEKLVHNIPCLFDLSQLTKLSLYEYDVNSWMWKDHLACSPDLRNLTHFNLHSRDSRHTFDRDWEFFEGLFRKEESDLLRDMFARNKNLQHVSLHIFALAAMSLEPFAIDDENQLSASSDDTPYLWPLRHSLKTLSLLDMMSTIKRSVQFPSKSELDAVCSEFGALEQFGIRVPEQDGFYYTDAAEIHTHVLGHLEPIKKLKDLRILHLYQDRIRLSHAEPPARDPWEQTLTFATKFFRWAHTSCPHLNVLVWGRFTETIDDEIFDMFDVDPDRGPALLELKQVERVGQQCFIKQFTQDENGATHITALRVSRKQLRNDYPDLDILSCDTSIDVKDRLSREVLY